MSEENTTALINFAVDLRQDILNMAEQEGTETLVAEAFTQYMIQELAEAGDLDEGIACYHRAAGMEVSGYNLGDGGDTLDLFTTSYTQQLPPSNITQTDVKTAFSRLLGFLKKASTNYYKSLEEASPVFDMAHAVNEVAATASRIRLFLFTDSISPRWDKLPRPRFGTAEVTLHVWDLVRLFRHVSSGRRKEEIEVDFEELFGEPLPCLRAARSAAEFDTFLAILPGKALNAIYTEYGSRLLERNVRSFLQAKGKVNQGIIRTIREQPTKFISYNNGLSTTASGIELREMEGGGLAIRSIRDLQIVNGGQTTASIHHAARSKISIEAVDVQVKITVVPPDRVDEVVPDISRFANTQNKISDADFSANDPFHVTLESLSRSVWAPAADGTHRQSKWFYERARGQYLDAVRQEGTPAKQREFTTIYPQGQKFTKTDVARYESTWSQLPQIVSLGAQKCFSHFMMRRASVEGGAQPPDEQYFEQLIGKAILHHRAEKIITDMKYGGYRANLVAYTLAYISMKTAQRLDLARIWQRQAISPALEEYIGIVSRVVHGAIIDAPGSGNVTEWCKKPGCWERVSALEVPMSNTLEHELIKGQGEAGTPEHLLSRSADLELHHLKRVAEVGSAGWRQLGCWAEETGHLSAYQRGVATSIATLLTHGKVPTPRQVRQGIDILQEADEAGFVVGEGVAV